MTITWTTSDEMNLVELHPHQFSTFIEAAQLLVNEKTQNG